MNLWLAGAAVLLAILASFRLLDPYILLVCVFLIGVGCDRAVKTHTAFLRICRVLKEVFRWFGHCMACQSHDVFALLPGVTGHSNRQQFCG